MIRHILKYLKKNIWDREGRGRGFRMGDTYTLMAD